MALIVQHSKIASSQVGGNDTRDLPIAKSDCVQNVKYDASNMQLTVTFKDGGEYPYFQVPSQVFDELEKAPSKGRFYVQAIKGKFPSNRTINKTIGKDSAKENQKVGRKYVS